MALITWSKQFEVGHPEIDKQHQELIRIVNRLHDAMLARQGRDALGAVFKDLDAYTRMHFRTEEDLMARFGYGEAVSHKKIHDDLIGELKKLHADFDAGKLSVTMATMTFLQNWLTKHIAQVDKKLSSFLAGRV